ncbi:MAG: SBBP repeat-containing protein [Ignavibacteria bacterium]|nr:SBBP repeat-containing protein [Ignavibacteria bacterium]
MSAYQSSNAGGTNDAFVTKLNSNGSTLAYSTYIGGSNYDAGRGIAVDGSGNAYITGTTGSMNFPTFGAYQSSNAGGTNDAFVTKLNSNGSTLAYSTYIGGSNNENGLGIAVDGSGNAYITGTTRPRTSRHRRRLSVIQFGGLDDAFVTNMNSSGSTLIYSTYLGGRGIDYGSAIAVDGSGNAYVTGYPPIRRTFRHRAPISQPTGEGMMRSSRN